MKNKRKIEIVGDSVGTLVKLCDFPEKYSEFLDISTDGNALKLEERGKAFMEKGFDDHKSVCELFDDVTRWTGISGNRVRGNVHRDYSKEKIAEAIGNAGKFLQKGNIKSAISTMTDMTGVEIASGSLVLRVLSPQQTAAYDVEQQRHWSYTNDAAGYEEFCNDCKKVVSALNERGIKNLERNQTGGKWFVADMDMVFFYLIKKINAS